MQDLKKNQSLSNDAGQAATVTRSLITKKATQGSGGIKVATASQSSGTGALAGQNTTNVKSDIGDAVENTKRRTKSGTLKRSSENIQLAFEKHKPAIFALYHRALRKAPSLQGRVNFRLTILPSGKVSKCSIVSSELNDPALEKRLIARIKRINFGAMDVATWNDTYLINFLPT
ncbi:AgmX/PglI C-terminal domain-containing protein [Aliikangiella coralliicola]|uniref:AgmX/PglI C-terminal domain-containing protein n=2 Tax=Aliikangiella coralliicola TaxID=2592383 RepID=A0A545U4Z1_9GAMM|nr:AgmX/PglI C-terminal domain-containing protein [Aliikangiella coralliicola]